MRELWYDYTNNTLGHNTTMAKSLANGIRIEVMLACKLLDSPATFFADTR